MHCETLFSFAHVQLRAQLNRQPFAHVSSHTCYRGNVGVLSVYHEFFFRSGSVLPRHTIVSQDALVHMAADEPFEHCSSTKTI